MGGERQRAEEMLRMQTANDLGQLGTGQALARDVLALVERAEAAEAAADSASIHAEEATSRFVAAEARAKKLEEALRQLAESGDYYVTSYVEMDGVKLDEWARRLLASAPAAEREDRV